jgi:preprotein translocase subunit SecD
MSTPPRDSGEQPGAVRVSPDRVERAEQAQAATQQEAAARTEAEAQAARVEAEARAEEIHAETARTEVRRAESETAKAADAVAEAEQRRDQAQAAEREAREHEERARGDAEQARDQVHGAPAGAPPVAGYITSRGFVDSSSGEPIVFGPFTAERPELLVVAALVGGFLVAKIVRGIAGS